MHSEMKNSFQSNSSNPSEECKSRPKLIKASKSTAQNRRRLRYNPGSVYYQANRLADSMGTISNSSSVSESVEVILSELDNPKGSENEGSSQKRSQQGSSNIGHKRIFKSLMSSIEFQHEASKATCRQKKFELKQQLLKLVIR